MMDNYSENWLHIKSILVGYETNNHRFQHSSYKDHVQAKALAVFLAGATLATPKLDRATVEAILEGRQFWPHQLGEDQFKTEGISLSVLEEYGLVSFNAGWCSLHCQSVRNLADLDPSIIPLIRAVEHLRDIIYGQNGYIRPHYACPANEFIRLSAIHFGNTPIAELLPTLYLEGDNFHLTPGNNNVSHLVSTYLWLALREALEPMLAFEHWIFCLRSNCDRGIPPLFEYLEHEEQVEFQKQLMAFLAQDPDLHDSMASLQKQTINKLEFVAILMPIDTVQHANITGDGIRARWDEHKELEKTTLQTLGNHYPIHNVDDSNDLQFVLYWSCQIQHWRSPEMFYTGLVDYIIKTNIGIEGGRLFSSDILANLLKLAPLRPKLKYMLYISLPERENTHYLIWLLSQPTTCDIALLYLTRKKFTNSSRGINSFTLHFEKGYQQLICHEYLRTLGNEPDNDIGPCLINAVAILGDRCDLNSRDFAKGFEYQFLLYLLDGIDKQHIRQLSVAFIQYLTKNGQTLVQKRRKYHSYLLGFWLIEELENVSPNNVEKLRLELQSILFQHYKREFLENLDGMQGYFEPNLFFSTLPWHKLQNSVTPILEFSKNLNLWQTKISRSSENNFYAASAIRHYIQVLMCIGYLQKAPKARERVNSRLGSIVCQLGFGSHEQKQYIFNNYFPGNEFDLWPSFCTYTNLFPQNIFDDFIECCAEFIPLDLLFILLKHCHIIARDKQLQDLIISRQSLENEDLGLTSIEQAFISACDYGNVELAQKLLERAKNFLSQERFLNTEFPNILRGHKVWRSYEYKLQLLELRKTLTHAPEEFENAAWLVPIPHEPYGAAMSENEREHRQECERFRRYIIAAAYCESTPEKCVCIMEALCKEKKNLDHSFLLFIGRINLIKNNIDTSSMQYALSDFLHGLGDYPPEDMPLPWVAKILDTYKQLKNAQEIDAFWQKLNSDQKARKEILIPYCRALVERGDALIAQQIVNRYRKINVESTDDLGISDLLGELCKGLPVETSMRDNIRLLNEDLQPNIVQLRRHYTQIIAQEFKDYVAIVNPKMEVHEFLKNVVLEVAQELLLRKKNLQIQSKHQSGRVSFKITQEDLINDWFTSLFDRRMAEAKLGCRDQKRGGESASNKSVGEIDAYITDAKNKRIAILEAFRLFSKDTTVISEHLNKIAGYDQEGLSPVFIVAYCDVEDFPGLTQRYAKFIASQDYTGFTPRSTPPTAIETLNQNDNLWLGKESRYRNGQEIIFYHLLLNMHFKNSPANQA